VLLSLLDRSRTRTGHSDADALQATLRRARLAEQLGLHRFWVAEHHGVPGAVGSAPTVLMAAVAAVTSRIRVGTAGVMLPNHNPFVVAEQLATLGALHPRRIDVGIGRSLGFTAPVRRALGATSADGFEDRLTELLDWLHGRGPLTLRPQAPPPPLWVLATGRGLEVAARFGLPVVAAGPLLEDPGPLQRYRADSPPGRARVTLSVDVLVADSAAQARRELLPQAVALARTRSRGEFPALPTPAEAASAQLTTRELADVERTLASTVFGDEDEVAQRLQELVERTGAVELMATATLHDAAAEAEADTRLARLVPRLRTGG
jgi:luciferase family oxidoreductase group 1